MAKEAIKYYGVDPWKITETGFNPERGRVSESIFSLGNEYMGTRGYAAPEQLHGKISAASDFYALGKTMEVLCGKKKFRYFLI